MPTDGLVCPAECLEDQAKPALLERRHLYTIMDIPWCMALNIKNVAVERLAEEVARLTGETKTEAIRKALQERRRQLKKPFADQRRHVIALLERKVWPTIPARHRGQRLTRAEEDQILGYGPEGV